MKAKKFRILDIAVIGIMTAILLAAKVALDFLPNIELVSFLVIIYGLCFGWRVMCVIPVFIVVQALLYPFGDWVIMYTYIWWIPAVAGLLFKKVDNVWVWSIFSGVYGLLFGALCSVTYFALGWIEGGVSFGLSTAFAKWISGIPFDLTHCIGNFAVMLILYKPIRNILTRIKKTLSL